MNALIYDCEILNCVPERDGSKPNPAVTYCAGWHDHKNMGLTCIGVWDYAEERSRVFLEDNFGDFQALVKERDIIIGFNSLYFDDLLCAANGIEVKTTYDVLVQVRRATGQPDEYVRGRTRIGYSLDELARASLGRAKTGHGAQAPALWQMGECGKVIDYCLNDIALTKALIDRFYHLIDPTDETVFEIAPPWGTGGASC